MNEVLADIAKRVLNIETLETRKMDSLDFHEVSVASLRDVIRKAFEAGLAAGKAK